MSPNFRWKKNWTSYVCPHVSSAKNSPFLRKTSGEFSWSRYLLYLSNRVGWFESQWIWFHFCDWASGFLSIYSNLKCIYSRIIFIKFFQLLNFLSSSSLILFVGIVEFVKSETFCRISSVGCECDALNDLFSILIWSSLGTSVHFDPGARFFSDELCVMTSSISI